jgi:hypothetical protein
MGVESVFKNLWGEIILFLVVTGVWKRLNNCEKNLVSGHVVRVVNSQNIRSK